MTSEITAKRKELEDKGSDIGLKFFNLGVEMARKEKIHSSNLSSDFQDGYNKARKDFLDKINEWNWGDVNHFINKERTKIIHPMLFLEELKQSLSGEKT